jgi:4-amino-4-deoxy-L-arabinose transferase-like glycosyltransferase
MSRQSILLLAAALVVIHLATAARYGIFRDELYYIACAHHLAWGYVDHPPFVVFIARIVSDWLGVSLLALRLLPAIAAGLLVLITARIARELGGGRFAQTLAAFAILPVPITLILNHWLTMNAFEPLIWTVLAWAALRAMNANDGKYWLLAGAMAGVGLENKYSISLFGFGLLVGLALTTERRWFGTGWFWLAFILAALIFLPNLIWLWQHDFPFLEFERHSRMSGSRIERGPLAFILDQALIMNPLLMPLCILGLWWLFRNDAVRAGRVLGWAVTVTFTVLLMVKGKNYYVAPIYPILFAAGAGAAERATAHRLLWARPAYVGALAASGVILAPLVIPILPVDSFIRMEQALGGFTPVTFEALPPAPLPQYFADEFGWEEMVRETARAYAAVPAEQRAQTAIFANDYGQAAAIDFFGPRYGLPPSISRAESFWLWGPRQYTGTSVIVLGSDGSGDRAHFATVQVVGNVRSHYARADERFDIFWCRDLTAAPNLDALWPAIRSW